MKKLLSVLLIVSTLFLSIGIQACSAKCIDVNSQIYEEHQKDLEIQELKKLLKDAEARNEKNEKEKQEKEMNARFQNIEKRLNEFISHNEQIKNEKKQKEYSQPSFWSRLKNVFSFTASVLFGTGLVTIPLGAIITICYYPIKALELCANDKDYNFWSPKKGHDYFSQFKNIKFKDALNFTIDAIPNILSRFSFVFLQTMQEQQKQKNYNL